MTKGAAEAALTKGAPEESVSDTITASATLWVWSGGTGGTWHFVTITGAAAEALHGEALMRRLENGGWMLPIKASVRKAEGVGAGDEVTLGIALI